MNVTELRTFIGKFGEIRAGETGYKKTLNGTLKDMDTRGTVWFVDNEGWGYAFKAPQIESFLQKEFTPMPTEFNGRPIHYEGGRAYYDNGKECDLKK
jgi:hypothetical protein